MEEEGRWLRSRALGNATGLNIKSFCCEISFGSDEGDEKGGLAHSVSPKCKGKGLNGHT